MRPLGIVVDGPGPTRPEIEALSVRIVQSDQSDHMPVVVRLRLP